MFGSLLRSWIDLFIIDNLHLKWKAMIAVFSSIGDNVYKADQP